MGTRLKPLRPAIVAGVLSLLVSTSFAAAGVSPAQAARDPAFLRSESFQTPSRNIGCGSLRVGERTYLRCDIRSGLRPQPRWRCRLDWTGLAVETRGRAAAVCAGDTVAARRAPVLAYGRTWSRRGITCASRTSGLTCRNRSGHGFFLSRERWRLF